MKQLSDFLDRFKNIAATGQESKKVIMEVLKKNGIQIDDLNKIKVKGYSLKIQTSPIQKSELFLKKQKILKELGENPLTKKVQNII